MNPTLEVLAALAAQDDEWVHVRAAQQKLPGQLAALEQRLSGAKKASAQAAAELDRLRLERRDKEGQMKDAEAQAVRLEAQLPQLKSPEAYTARMHEIEMLKTRRSELETHILTLLEREETQEGLAESKSRAARDAADKGAGERAELESLRSGLRVRMDATEAARAELMAKLEAPMRSRYERTFVSRQGQAISRVAVNACGTCHATLPPQELADVKKGDTVQVCDACGRMLVWVGP